MKVFFSKNNKTGTEREREREKEFTKGDTEKQGDMFQRGAAAAEGG